MPRACAERRPKPRRNPASQARHLTGQSWEAEFGLHVDQDPGAGLAGKVSLDDPLRVPSEFADDNLTDNTAAVTVTALANVVGGEGGTGGALPVTGAKTSTLALGGFALLSAGLVVRYATRRRTA